MDTKYPSSKQDFTALAQASGVSREWQLQVDNPYLWKKFHLPVNSTRSAEEVLHALNTPRLQQISYIKFIEDELLGCDKIEYGMQTKLEELQDIPPDFKDKVRKLFRTPPVKIRLHNLMKTKSAYNQIPVINPYNDHSSLIHK